MYQYKARVNEIVDGDTIGASVQLGFDVSLQLRFRLNGINTPESRTKDLEEKARGMKAKARLMDLVLGEEVVIISDKQEKFGRYLATIMLGDINVNETLIAEGHAVPYDGKSPR